jgi:uncharacterized membrane-anchored protein YjiN (DUF445 family)
VATSRLDTPPTEDGPPPRSAVSPPPMKQEAVRAEQLRIAKRRATGLLVAMTVAYMVLLLFTDDAGIWAYLRAATEGSMVGGLADWFAVTAIFRHPLGLPIPHTAVIPARKEQFGETLGAFVQQNFLSPEVLAERVRSARIGERAADWLSEPGNAESAAGHAADLVVAVADVIKDEDVHRVVESELDRAVKAIPAAPLAGRALRMMTDQGRHEELLDALLRGLQRYLDDNRQSMRDRFGQQSPRWLPGAVEERIFERLYDGVGNLLREANNDPNHEVRAQFTEWLRSLIERLEASPELEERGDDLKRELLTHPELRRWTASLWTETKARLRAQADDRDSELRRRLADAVCAAGTRLREDAALRAKLDELAESAARYVAEHFHDEIAGLVSGTIARWDAEQTSTRLELLLGRDLQFIRINGTVVGGLAGLAIHAVATGLG